MHAKSVEEVIPCQKDAEKHKCDNNKMIQIVSAIVN